MILKLKKKIVRHKLYFSAFPLIAGKPIITYESHMKDGVKVKAGNSLILTVNLQGYPDPRSHWYHNDKEIFAGGDTTIESDATFSRLTIKPSAGKHTGTYKIEAENKVGKGSAEFDVLVRDRPAPPKNVRTTEVYKDFITLTWDVPENDGGSPITGYSMEKRDVKKSAYTSAGTTDADTLTLKATRLIEGNEYFFKVYAENDIGTSDPAETEDPIKARLPFGESYFT